MKSVERATEPPEGQNGCRCGILPWVGHIVKVVIFLSSHLSCTMLNFSGVVILVVTAAIARKPPGTHASLVSEGLNMKE